MDAGSEPEWQAGCPGSDVKNKSHPFWPGLGALLLNCRDSFCLNLGGVAFLPSAAAFMADAADDRDRKMPGGRPDIISHEPLLLPALNWV